MHAAAVAHPNIALVKYWGKQPGPGNRPAVPSLSVTLNALYTHTRVRFDPALDGDRFTINGDADPSAADRVSQCLDALRARSGHTRFAEVSSHNNFPTGAGLASSASGFAALVVAADRALGLGLAREELARIARRSSGSAARSLYGGFVEMPLAGDDSGETAYPLLAADAWPLSVVVAITATGSKQVGSSEGMRHSAGTSDYYPAWLASAGDDFDAARAAVTARDFAGLARVSERSCLKMHALMLSADPGLIYWNPTTVACLHTVRGLREKGVAAFFTMDAGPQVKVLCPPNDRARVARTLGALPGVLQVLESGLGPGAAVAAETP